MSLDPQARRLMETLAAASVPSTSVRSVVDERRGMAAIIPLGGVLEPVAYVEDRLIAVTDGAITVRIYTPEGDGPFPILVYFHGGGWVLGNLAIFDTLCRKLTSAAGCITVAVDFRLAPEHKFPIATEDCYAATLWASKNSVTFNGDPEPVAVVGDSAGGNLAAAVTLMARERGCPALRYQVLICPPMDHYSAGSASYEENAEGYYLTKKDMLWFWDHYLASEKDVQHPYASPLRANDLSNLPPALVITAEFDPLRDEGERYAERLRLAGVPVTLTRYNGMMHAFINMAGVLDQSRLAFDQIATELRTAFHLHVDH